jgi:hypothetical protein
MRAVQGPDCAGPQRGERRRASRRVALAPILARFPPLSADRDSPASGDSRRLARDRLDQHDRLQAEFRYCDDPLVRHGVLRALASFCFALAGRRTPALPINGSRSSGARVSSERHTGAVSGARFSRQAIVRAGIRSRVRSWQSTCFGGGAHGESSRAGVVVHLRRAGGCFCWPGRSAPPRAARCWRSSISAVSSRTSRCARVAGEAEARPVGVLSQLVQLEPAALC